MTAVSRTEQVDAGLIEIAEFISTDNPDAAARVVAKVETALEMLGSNPKLGRARPDIGPNARAFPVGSYIVVYRPIDRGIEIVRVVHGARYLPGLVDRA